MTALSTCGIVCDDGDGACSATANLGPSERATTVVCDETTSEVSGAETNHSRCVGAKLCRHDEGDDVKRKRRRRKKMEEDEVASCFFVSGGDDSSDSCAGDGVSSSNFVWNCYCHYHCYSHGSSPVAPTLLGLRCKLMTQAASPAECR